MIMDERLWIIAVPKVSLVYYRRLFCHTSEFFGVTHLYHVLRYICVATNLCRSETYLGIVLVSAWGWIVLRLCFTAEIH